MTNATQDYYQLLGVDESASQDEIRTSYRELARKYHPDKTGGDKVAEDQLKEINAAYDVLKKPEKRKEYDAQRKFGGYGGGFDFSGGGASTSDFADIFSSIFGGQAGARPRSAARAGNDLEAGITVTLADVVAGTKKTLRINRPESCTECNGSGAAPGTSRVTCPECAGAGHVTRGNGFIQTSHTCSRCSGTGETAATPCGHCAGSGRSKARREITVNIPAGVDAHTRLRIAGEGEAGHFGGPRGDLYVHVKIKKDPFFTREGTDIVCEVPVTFVEAALGAKIDVPTLDGVAKLTVEAGTQTGTQLRMRGMGLPPVGGGRRGDERIKVLVEVPKKLSREQVKLLKEFDGQSLTKSHPIREKFERLLKKFRPSD